MPTSYGSIGKQYTDSIKSTGFNRHLGVFLTKNHTSSLQPLSVAATRLYFTLDQKVLNLNTQKICYVIEGITAQFAIVKSQTVRLYEQVTGQFITEQKSSINGEFLFLFLDPDKKYTLTSKDEDGILESVILDTVSPKIINS